MQRYRVTRVTGVDVERNVSGVFREHKVTMTKYPYCTPADFDKFVRLAGPGTADMSGLFRTGLYVDDLIRWEKAVPRERTLVVFHEDFVADAVALIDRIQSFLGVPHFRYENITYRQGNFTFLRGATSKADGPRRYEPMSKWATSALNTYYGPHTARLMTHLRLKKPPTKWPRPLK